MQAKTEEAEAERARALNIESAMAQGAAFPGVFAHATYHLCADPIMRERSHTRGIARKPGFRAHRGGALKERKS